MTTIHASIDVDAATHELYGAWSRFGDFPQFMEGVKTVSAYEHEGHTITEWKLEVEGKPVEFQARLVERIPGRRIAWTTTTEQPGHSGVVTFHRISDGVSRVIVEMDYEPSGFLQHVGDLLGVPGNLLERNLEHFKRWIEDGVGLAGETGGEPSVSAYALRAPSGLV